MIRFALLPFVCLLAAGVSHAEDILGQGDFRYRVVPSWGREALAQVNVKNGHAVALDSQGRLLFLTDDVRNNVIILDPKTGTLIKHWTARMPGAHGMSLVREGEREVLFITDTQLHEVRKLTLDGEELAQYPWPEKAKLHASANEYRPSKTIHFANGEICVFDGYGKDYIFHYKPDGTLLRWCGALDVSDSAKTRLIIAMSDQQEIKRFTAEGHFIDKIAMPGGNPRDIVFCGEFAIVPHLGDQWPKDRNSPGFISIVDREYRIVSNIGAPAAVYQDGVLRPMQSDHKTFIHPHGVAVDAEGNLYVAQFSSQAAPLLKLERIK